MSNRSFFMFTKFRQKTLFEIFVLTVRVYFKVFIRIMQYNYYGLVIYHCFLNELLYTIKINYYLFICERSDKVIQVFVKFHPAGSSLWFLFTLMISWTRVKRLITWDESLEHLIFCVIARRVRRWLLQDIYLYLFEERILSVEAGRRWNSSFGVFAIEHSILCY